MYLQRKFAWPPELLLLQSHVPVSHPDFPLYLILCRLGPNLLTHPDPPLTHPIYAD